MSDQLTTEDWQDINRERKDHTQDRIDKELKATTKTCKALGVTITEFNPNSFRLTKEGKPTIDWYPKSRKVYNHGKQRWTNSVRVITSLIEVNFK